MCLTKQQLTTMTEQSFPITPPPELVASLRNLAPHGIRDAGATRELWLIHNAYAAGADQELEACCKWLPKLPPWSADDLRRHRRPEPPSLKAGAIEVLDELDGLFELPAGHYNTILRALEALDD